MSVLALIPARMGSKGVPGKNIKPLGGIPLIAHSIKVACRAPEISRVVVSTDSEEIASIGREWGAETPFLRPAEFATDSAPATDYISHCLNYMEKYEGWVPRLVVLLQPTTPFRTVDDVSTCLNLAGDAESVVSVCEVPGKYHPAWQFMIHDDKLLPWGRAIWGKIPTQRQSLPKTYQRNGAVYVFSALCYKSTGSIYSANVHAYVMPIERSVNIDGPEDWLLAEKTIHSWSDL